MNDESKEMARITKLHYDYANQYNEDPKKVEQQITKEIPGWTLQNELSNRGIMVLDKDNKRVISIKGTDPKNASDLLSDAQLALGLQKSNIQFRQRKNDIKNIIRREPNKEYYLTGHSLGGSILTNAISSSPSIMRNVKKAYTFNSGGTPAFEAMLKPRKENISIINDKLTHYKTKADVISATPSRFGDTYYVKQKSRNPFSAHTIMNFI